MSRIRQRSHAPVTSLATEQRRQVREIARREFDRDGHTVPRHLLDRGETDPYSGEVSLGLPSTKLREQLLSGTEGVKLHHKQNRPSYLDGFGLPSEIPSLHNDVKLTRENVVGPIVGGGNINGQLTKGQISGNDRWGKTDQHTDTAYTNDIVKKGNQLSWADGKDYIPGDAIKGIAAGKVNNAPWLSKVPKGYVKKSQLKPSAFKKKN